MKLVLVEWLDSHSGTGWQPLHSLRDDTHAVRCRSVGWLLNRRNGHTTIVPHISGEQDGVVPYGSGEKTIPDKAIVRIKVLAKS
jgi:hypothetical protein